MRGAHAVASALRHLRARPLAPHIAAAPLHATLLHPLMQRCSARPLAPHGVTAPPRTAPPRAAPRGRRTAPPQGRAVGRGGAMGSE